MTDAAEAAPAPPTLVPVAPRDVAFALLRAMSKRRHGHAQRELDSTRNQLLADLLAEALLADGYVLARPLAPPPGPGIKASP